MLDVVCQIRDLLLGPSYALACAGCYLVDWLQSHVLGLTPACWFRSNPGCCLWSHVLDLTPSADSEANSAYWPQSHVPGLISHTGSRPQAGSCRGPTPHRVLSSSQGSIFLTYNVHLTFYHLGLGGKVLGICKKILYFNPKSQLGDYIC